MKYLVAVTFFAVMIAHSCGNTGSSFDSPSSTVVPSMSASATSTPMTVTSTYATTSFGNQVLPSILAVTGMVLLAILK